MFMSWWKKLDDRYGDNDIWQFIKFNIIGQSISLLQLILVNLLPFVFDGLTIKLSPCLQLIFDPEKLPGIESRYVIDGVVTWAYVLPFFLSNLLANIYGYFINMKKTFRGKGTRKGLILFFAVMFILILFTTWVQGVIASALNQTSLAYASRTIAALAAGLIQFAVVYPLEKYVLFKEKTNE